MSVIATQYIMREKVREVCAKYGFDNEAFVVELTGVLSRALFGTGGEIRQYTVDDIKEMVGDAINDGVRADAGFRADWERLFKTTPNWDTKSNRAFLNWVKSRPQSERLDVFASWWWANDWRGAHGQPPTTDQVRENWLRAFSEESITQNVQTAKKGAPERANPLPEGL